MKNVNAQSHVHAGLIKSRWERQQRGIWFKNRDDPPADKEAYEMACEVLRLSDLVYDLQFENQALKGEIPEAAPPVTLQDIEIENENSRTLPETTREYYGYPEKRAYVFIGNTDHLANSAVSGDVEALNKLALLANIRTTEILRLEQISRGETWDLNDWSVTSVMERGITGGRYTVLLSDATVSAKKAEQDITSGKDALFSILDVSNMCTIRASHIMELISKLKKLGLDHKDVEVSAESRNNF